MQPASHPLTPQPPLILKRPLTLEDFEDVTVTAARVAELAPATRESLRELPTPRPDAPRVMVTPSSTPVPQTLVAVRTAAAPATASRKPAFTWNRVGLAALSSLPDLVARLEVAEQRLLACGPQFSFLGFLKPFVVRVSAVKAHWQLHRYIRRGLQASTRTSTVTAAESKRLRRTGNAYIERRVSGTRRVAEFQGYERLFSLWHALRIPLIFMLIVAAVVHVIAVNVY